MLASFQPLCFSLPLSLPLPTPLPLLLSGEAAFLAGGGGGAARPGVLGGGGAWRRGCCNGLLPPGGGGGGILGIVAVGILFGPLQKDKNSKINSKADHNKNIPLLPLMLIFSATVKQHFSARVLFMQIMRVRRWSHKFVLHKFLSCHTLQI